MLLDELRARLDEAISNYEAVRTQASAGPGDRHKIVTRMGQLRRNGRHAELKQAAEELKELDEAQATAKAEIAEAVSLLDQAHNLFDQERQRALRLLSNVRLAKRRLDPNSPMSRKIKTLDDEAAMLRRVQADEQNKIAAWEKELAQLTAEPNDAELKAYRPHLALNGR